MASRPEDARFPAEGRCTCGAVRYRMAAAPIIVHACHCRWCQRETGAAFALNAVVEAAHLHVLRGAPEEVPLPSESGRGQRVLRCPDCRIALWSHYPGGGPGIAFVRVGTLDDPGIAPPDVHIYTASKQPWLALPAGAQAYAEFYDPKTVWPEAARERYRAAKAGASPSA